MSGLQEQAVFFDEEQEEAYGALGIEKILQDLPPARTSQRSKIIAFVIPCKGRVLGA